ncbi:MAG: T9SS type A sorting domain-containing protein [Bacteroidia bacterium]|nr:T9SS type A sorting domain-containing protein [Bacteroidia bacterium]
MFSQTREVGNPHIGKGNPHSSKAGEIDTIWDVYDSAQSLYITTADYFWFADYPIGYHYGTNYEFNTFHNKYLPYVVETGLRFEDYDDVRVTEVFMYAGVELEGSGDEVVTMKVYTITDDSMPGELKAKGSITTGEIQEAWDSSEFVHVVFDVGDNYIKEGGFFIAADFSRLVEDSLFIVNSYFEDSIPFSTNRNAMRFSSFRGGRWFPSDWYHWDNYVQSEVIIIPILERSPSVGVENIKSKPGIFIYPNPVSNELVFEWDKLNETKIEAQLINGSGQKVLTKTIRYGETLDVRNLSDGAYYLIMIIDNQHVAQKINITK